jgi:hypothetical protein
LASSGRPGRRAAADHDDPTVTWQLSRQAIKDLGRGLYVEPPHFPALL